MGRTSKSLLGKTFGLLTVIAYESRNRFGNSRWTCECKCGTKISAYYQNLTRGHVRSCGCMPRRKKNLLPLESYQLSE